MKRTSLFLALVLCALPLSAQLTRGQSLDYTWNPTVIDINHDGLDDVILGNHIWLNAGGSTFVDGGVVASLPSHVQLTPGDFNGDGIVDFLAFNVAYATGTSMAPAGLNVMLGRPDGSYVKAWADSPENGAVVANLDDDHLTDLIVFHADENANYIPIALTLTLMRSNGDGTFTVTQRLHPPPSSLPEQFLSADLNLDGHPDLIVRNEDTLDVYLGHGDGTFAPAVRRFLPRNGATLDFLYPGDIDGDGNPDLVTAPDLGGHVVVLLGDGRGHFPRFATALLNSRDGVALVHVTSSSRFDIAGAEPNGDLVVLTWRDGGLHVASRTPTGLSKPYVMGGAFRSSSHSDLLLFPYDGPSYVYYPSQAPAAAVAPVHTAIGRTRAVRLPDGFSLAVQSRASCQATASDSWSFTSEGFFLTDNTRSDRTIEAVVLDGIMTVRATAPDGKLLMSGSLLEAEAGHYSGPIGTTDGCGSGMIWMDVYRQ